MKSLARTLSPYVLLLSLCAMVLPVKAGELPQGRKTITLVGAEGARLDIGHVTFTGADGGAAIAVQLDSPELKDEFLSMRPFRCLPDPEEMWCHLAYPYESKNFVTPADLTDLEYALLFLFKSPQSYGIDAWNGLYFKLEHDGAGGLSGKLHETDLNQLSVPGEPGNLRPITHAALTPAHGGTHRFSSIEIK